MKLLFRKEDIQNGINIVSRAIPSRTTNPILGCILINASAGEIKLTANDMDLGIETVVEGTIEEKGSVALEAKLLTDIIRKCDSPDSEISITTNGLTTVIDADSSKFTIQGRDGEEFPYLPMIEKDSYMSISQFTFREIVRQTAFSASISDTNRMMSGELIEVKENTARFTTLDGHRISIRNVTLKDSYGEMKAVVPVRSLNEISRILSGDNEKEILIYFSRNHLLFEFDRTVVVCSLIEGEYFRIDHMLSRDSETRVRVSKQGFISLIDRAMIFIRENDHKPIILNISEDHINISIRSSFGTMDGDVPCSAEGKELKIAFNPRFLIDALRAIDDDQVDIYFTNAKAPCFIRDEKESYIYLILPVNFVE